MEFLAGLPPFAIAIIVVLAIGIVFSLLKKLVKFGLMLAALAILVIVVLKLITAQP